MDKNLKREVVNFAEDVCDSYVCRYGFAPTKDRLTDQMECMFGMNHLVVHLGVDWYKYVEHCATHENLSDEFYESQKLDDYPNYAESLEDSEEYLAHREYLNG